jgi:hypothetical protein
MEYNIDKPKYLKLLKTQEFLRNKNISFAFQDIKAYSELLKFQIIVEGDLYYKNKSQYFQLIEDYFNQTVGEDETKLFVFKFLNIFKKDNSLLLQFEREVLIEGIEKLEALKIHPNSVKFSELIFRIFERIEKFDSKTDISDFMLLIKQNYLEMTKL